MRLLSPSFLLFLLMIINWYLGLRRKHDGWEATNTEVLMEKEIFGFIAATHLSVLHLMEITESSVIE
jgi:hypothetical protein